MYITFCILYDIQDTYKHSIFDLLCHDTMSNLFYPRSTGDGIIDRSVY